MTTRAARHTQVMRVLRSRILRGTYERRLPGERKLARELGTNPKTVQIALVQLESLGMVRRVERHGTFIVPPAESGREARMMYAKLALMTPLTDLEGAHFWASVIVYAFQKAAREHRLSMALEYSNNVDGVVADALAEAHYPGCVGTCLLAVVMETRHLIQLSEATGPVIAVECDPEEPLIPSLCFDNVGAGRIVAEHLLKLGHRRIAYVNYPSALSSHGDRLRAIEGSLHRAGLDLTATVTYTSEHPETVRNLLDGPDRPTAIISGSHFIAQVLMELVAGSGRRVPEDLSIVTFYGGQLDTGHRITMAEMDHRTLGRHALEMLLDEDLPDSPRRVLIPVGLSEAGTTAPPAR